MESFFVYLFCCVVVKVSLDVYDGSTLVTRSGGQVAQRSDKIGETTGSCALGCHVANQVLVLLLDFLLDSRLQLLACERCEGIVGKVLQLELVGSSLETCGVCRRNYRVCLQFSSSAQPCSASYIRI